MPKFGMALIGYAREIFRFRDLAVHPSGDMTAPIIHDELQVGVEWRFAYFRAGNAEALVKHANQIVWELVEKGKPANGEVERYANSLRERLSPLSAVKPSPATEV